MLKLLVILSISILVNVSANAMTDYNTHEMRVARCEYLCSQTTPPSTRSSGESGTDGKSGTCGCKSNLRKNISTTADKKLINQ